jgi:hypothetical protein
MQFVEQLRSVMNETSDTMIPSLDNLMKQTGHAGALEGGQDEQPAIESSKKSRSSADRG